MGIFALARQYGRDVARTGRDQVHAGVTDVRIAALYALKMLGSKRQRARPRILFIDEMLPDPRLGAGFPRAAEMINAMTAAGWQVAHFAKKSSSAHRAEMQRKFGGDVEFLAGQGKHGLIRVLREQGDSFAAIAISRPTTMMTFLSALQSRGCDKPLPYVFYDAEAIFVDREIARSELNGRGMSEDERDRGVEAEISLTSIADAVLVVSKADALVYEKHSQATVRVVNHAVRAAPGPATFDERSDIVIVGKMIGNRQDSPNVDSIFWYLEEVAPLLREHHGIHVPLTVVGNASADLRAQLANENVNFMGVVDDLAAVYNRARIMVAPTRFSAGIPLKVIEAAAAGVPCAVTERLAGQLEYSDDIHARVGSDAAGFARACADLYQCGDRWRRIRDVALQDVMQRYSTQQLFASVADALATATASSERKMAATFGTRKESMPMAILTHFQTQTPQPRSDVLSLLAVQSAPQTKIEPQREAQLA